MTLKQLFKKHLSSKKFKQLSKMWKDHIRRIDSLPKAKKCD